MPTQPEAQMAAAVRAAIDLRRLPWIRPLVAAYTSDFDSVAKLFAGNPADPAAWSNTIARVQQAPRDRLSLERIVSAQLEARGAPPEARASAKRLADQASIAVVTGQQAGLFGGPLYTLLKAVTAIQLARRVQAERGVAAIPVFWVDAEDHDWGEVRSTTVLDSNLAPVKITLPQVDGAGVKPIASLVLNDGIAAALGSLETVVASTEFTSELMSLLRRHYRPGTGMATAFAGWIDTLLGGHGLVVFEAADPAAKPLVADIFAREIDNPCRTTKLALEAAKTMAAMGHQPQVEPAEDSVALFYLDQGGRRSIKRRGSDFVMADQERRADDLRAEAQTHPEHFSPNVLLRPLVQDRLFPTVCYVAGPSELAYQAQLGGIYREFGVEAPLLFPRATATILDSGATRFLERYRLPLEALQAHDESALNKLLDSQLPPTVEQAIEETATQVAERARLLKDAVVVIDSTLSGAVDTTLERMRETLKSLHSKIIQATKRKDETLRRQFNRTRALAFPEGHAQERIVSIVFFVNRYGPELGERLLDALPLETDKHYVVTL